MNACPHPLRDAQLPHWTPLADNIGGLWCCQIHHVQGTDNYCYSFICISFASISSGRSPPASSPTGAFKISARSHRSLNCIDPGSFMRFCMVRVCTFCLTAILSSVIRRSDMYRLMPACALASYFILTDSVFKKLDFGILFTSSPVRILPTAALPWCPHPRHPALKEHIICQFSPFSFLLPLLLLRSEMIVASSMLFFYN